MLVFLLVSLGGDPATTARAVPIYASTSFCFADAQDAADLFGLKVTKKIFTGTDRYEHTHQRIAGSKRHPLVPSVLTLTIHLPSFVRSFRNLATSTAES